MKKIIDVTKIFLESEKNHGYEIFSISCENEGGKFQASASRVPCPLFFGQSSSSCPSVCQYKHDKWKLLPTSLALSLVLLGLGQWSPCEGCFILIAFQGGCLYALQLWPSLQATEHLSLLPMSRTYPKRYVLAHIFPFFTLFIEILQTIGDCITIYTI